MDNIVLVLYDFFVTGESEAFERDYERSVPQQHTFPGHLGEMLTRSSTTPSRYLIVSKWQAPAFQQWLQAPAHDVMTQLLDRHGRYQSHVQKQVVVYDGWETYANRTE